MSNLDSRQMKNLNRKRYGVSGIKRGLIMGMMAGAFGICLSQGHVTALPQDGASVVSPQGKAIQIEIGKGQLIRLSRPADSVFVANPAIADVQVKSPRIIYLLGKASGETSFFAMDKDDKTIYSAEVTVNRNLRKVQAAIKSLMPDHDIQIQTIGGMVLLQGNVSSPDEAASVENIVKGLAGVTSVMNKLNIMQPTQVNLRVRIAEVSRSSLKQLGVRWQSLLGGNATFGVATGGEAFNLIEDPATGLPLRNFLRGAGGVGNYIGSYTSGNVDLNLVIDAMDDEGFLTVLAEPNLTALSGAAADFLAGGEFPVPIPNEDGIGIQYRRFGVSLKFKPTVIDSGRITLEVEPEVSDLSNAGAIRVNGISIPSITTRRAKTTVELGSGQSFAIAGLLENESVRSAAKLPGLGDIPILGALFKSKRFERNETELLIVVTPYVVRPVSDRKLALPTDGYIAPSDMDFFLRGENWKKTPTKKDKAPTVKKGPTLKKRAGFQLD